MLTKEQVIEKYGDIELPFSSYYKYSFSYSTTLDDGTVIYGSYGGCPDDIYRHQVLKDDVITVKYFEDYLNTLTIKKDHEILFKYYDY
jgi:hypothetical protein